MAADGSYATAALMYPVTRPVGQNDIGIVAWILTLKTPEYPLGRKVSPFTILLCCCEYCFAAVPMLHPNVSSDMFFRSSMLLKSRDLH